MLARLSRSNRHMTRMQGPGSEVTESSAGSSVSGGASSAMTRSSARMASESSHTSGWESDRKSVRFNLHRPRTASFSASVSGAGSEAPVMVTPDEFQGAVERLLAVNARAFAAQGQIPLTAPVTLFFQTPTGSCHVLRFPNDVPSRTFEAFMATCEPGYVPAPPRPTTGAASYSHHPYPTHIPVRNYLTHRASPLRPITSTFDLASHPVLETVKRSLFPNCSDGHYLVSALNRVDCYLPGGYSSTPASREPGSVGADDEPVVQIVVTMPVRFRGGVLVVNRQGNDEKFFGRGCISSLSSSQPIPPPMMDKKTGTASMGNMEWVAYLAGECDVKVSQVEKGVRVNLVYDVYMKSFGPFGGMVPRPLMVPNDGLLSALSSLLKRSRGRSLAFYLTNDYGISPAHVLAETLIPRLRGSDAALYHALKLYQLSPALRYLAGGFIWPTTSCASISPSSTFLEAIKRLAIKSAGDEEELTIQIEDGGGIPLEREGIVMATGAEQGRIGRERVAFLEAKEGMLDYLHVNVCLVVYVP